MNFIQNLQRAIDFMEKHILESITYEDVAQHLYMSNYHFHRTFSLMTGITPNEYIRNRRLSMAAHELCVSNKKVIDISLKYGYRSPESFAKAFTRFHGVTPSAASRVGTDLKSFNRLQIKVTVQGGDGMKYRIEKREAFNLLTKTRKFRNESISEKGNTEIPDFWQGCRENQTFDVLKKHSSNQDIYGVCAPISKDSAYFDYGIGMKFNETKVPDGYYLWKVKPRLWVVFKCIGENADCIAQTWEKIFSEFLPNSEYVMIDDTDFELYSEKLDCFCEIWIPIEHK